MTLALSKSLCPASFGGRIREVSDTIVNWYAKALDISKDAAGDSINSTIALKGSWEAAAPAIAAAGNAAIIAAQNLQRATALSTAQSVPLKAPPCKLT